MASPAQLLANAANAQHSTGPSTIEGKAKSARTATTHGLATGFLHIPESEMPAFRQFEANCKQAARPQGALERETCDQLVFAAWRLRRVHILIRGLYERLGADPLVTPDAAAPLRQLTRYRAALEMSFFRALKQLRELQTRRAACFLQLHEPERQAFPRHVLPNLYSAAHFTRGDRELLLEINGLAGPWPLWRVELDEDFLPLPRLQPISRE